MLLLCAGYNVKIFAFLDVCFSSSMSLPEKGTIVRSKRQLERRAKNRRAPKSNDVDDEGYVPQKVNAKKKLRQGFDSDDALQLFLWGPETKQLLTAKEEAELISHIQVHASLTPVSLDFLLVELLLKLFLMLTSVIFDTSAFDKVGEGKD